MVEPSGDAVDPLADLECEILGDPIRYTPQELWTRANVDEELARSLWLAMGFPHVPDDAVAFSEADARALERAAALVTNGVLEPQQLRRETRVLSQAMSAIANAHAERIQGDDTTGAQARWLSLDDLDETITYLYRRHLLAAVTQLLSATEGPTPGAARVVGFADLAGFTATAELVSEDRLLDLVDEFVSVAGDVVAAAGGRVVKLVGDEVMFTMENPARAAEAGLELAAISGDLPVHVGLALGPMASHHGDLFGPAVNMASRLTGAARPGTVLANEDLGRALKGDDRFDVRPARLRRPLKGIGPARIYVIRAASPSF